MLVDDIRKAALGAKKLHKRESKQVERAIGLLMEAQALLAPIEAEALPRWKYSPAALDGRGATYTFGEIAVLNDNQRPPYHVAVQVGNPGQFVTGQTIEEALRKAEQVIDRAALAVPATTG